MAFTSLQHKGLYHGWCARCRVRHSLPTGPAALHHARQLLMLLDHYQRFDFQVPLHEADPSFSTDYVWTRGPGRMMGVLVGRHPGDGCLHVLKAFSGQLTEKWICPGWVGPVASITSGTPVYEEARSRITAISEQIRALEDSMAQQAGPAASQSPGPAARSGPQPGVTPRKAAKAAKHASKVEQAQRSWPAWAKEQYRLLVNTRKAMSHELIKQVQDSYVTANQVGTRLPLLKAYQESCALGDQESAAFPAGTGDCCAPKLLHAAVQLGLLPIELCEFWYGCPPSMNTPQGRSSTQARSGSVRLGSPAEHDLGLSLLSCDGAAPVDARQDSRVHGHVYGACDKCQRILGAMLCDNEGVQ